MTVANLYLVAILLVGALIGCLLVLNACLKIYTEIVKYRVLDTPSPDPNVYERRL